MTRNVVHIYTREIDFNLELDIEFLGIRMLKGTPEYYEWLDKFLQKRKRKTNDTSSTNRIAREIFEENSKTRQSLEKAGDAAGPVFKELVSLLQGMQGPNAKDKSRENALKEQIYLLRNKAKNYIFAFEKEKEEGGKPFTEYRFIEITKGDTNDGYTEIQLPEGFDIQNTKIVTKGAYKLLSAKKNAGEMTCG